MGWRDRIRGFLGTSPSPRVDAGPWTPPGVLAGDGLGGVVRVDADRLQRRGDSSLFNSLTGMGGINDKGTTSRPNIYHERLTDSELLALYLYNGIARKIIDLLPQEGTRKGWRVIDGSDDPDPMSMEDQRLDVRARVSQAWSLARLWGGSIVVMVTTDDIPAEFRNDPELWLAQPLDHSRVISLDALQVFDIFEAQPQSWETDMRSPNFRMPRTWSITPSTPGTTRRSFAAVHASRVMFFRGRVVPPSFMFSNFSTSSSRAMDDSELQAIWDEVRNLCSTHQGLATLAHELRESVLTVSGLKGFKAGDQAAEVTTRLKAMARAKSLLGLILLSEGDKYENRSNPPTGSKELSEAGKAMLSAVTGFPQTILFGEPPSGLTSDNKAAKETMNRTVASAQADKLEPPLVQMYEVAYSAKFGPSRGVVPDEWSVEFNPLEEPTEGEIAGTRKIVAEGDAIYLDRGVVTPEQVRASRFGEAGYQFDLVPADSLEEDVEGDDFSAMERLREALGQGAPRLGNQPPMERGDATRQVVISVTEVDDDPDEPDEPQTLAGGEDGHTHSYTPSADRTGVTNGHWHPVIHSNRTEPSNTGSDSHVHDIPPELQVAE